MLTVTRSGSRATQIAADIRSLAGTQVPLIAAKALTFTVQKAQAAIVAEMPKVFKGGATPYTLRSTRIETATPQNLTARVAVKDQAPAGGTLPENFLFPSVFAGTRREKRFEKALRLGGLLKRGERAVPGQFAKLDAQGNQSVGELRALLNAVAGTTRGEPGKGRGRKIGRTAREVFVGQPGRGLPGIYRRNGKQLQPLVVFVTKPPTYRKRLDFEGIARETSLREFQPTFERLLLKAAGRG